MNIEIEAAKAEFTRFEERMQKAVDYLKSEFGLIRAGRANKNLLEKISVNCYGSPTPLMSIANIGIPEARLMTITLYDPSLIKDTSKAIQASDLGITPTDDGKTIRLVFPALTEEKRRDLVKQIKKMCEESKVTLRNHRRDTVEVIKKMKKDSKITEDDCTKLEKEVQKSLDKYLLNLEKVLADKEKELMEI